MANWTRDSRMIGGLSSALLHLCLLIVLGCLFLPRTGSLVLPLAATWSTDPPEQAFELQDLPATGVELHVPEADLSLFTLMVPTEDLVIRPVSALSLEADELKDPTRDRPSGPRAGGAFGTGGAGDQIAETTGDGQTNFFGIRAYGNQFVYVLDISTSMEERSLFGRTRFDVAASELIRSIDALEEYQEFHVVLFSYHTRFMLRGKDGRPRLIRATPQAKRDLRTWLLRVQLLPGTDPRFAVMTGLVMRPDAVFLLSDGALNGRTKNIQGIPGNPTVEQVVARHQGPDVPIHTIALESKRNRKRLRRLAQATGGVHRFISRERAIDVLLEDLHSQDPGDVLYALESVIQKAPEMVMPDKRLCFPALIQLLAVKHAEVRQLAHRGLAFLAAGDVDVELPEASTEEQVVAVQRAWHSIWEQKIGQGGEWDLARAEPR